MVVDAFSNDMAYLFTAIFQYPVVLMTSAVMSATFLYSLSVVTVHVLRGSNSNP